MRGGNMQKWRLYLNEKYENQNANGDFAKHSLCKRTCAACMFGKDNIVKGTDELTTPVILKQETVQVYPTNCINMLMVGNAQNNLLNYRILTYDGREISNGMLQAGKARINVSGYPAGAYWMFITGNGYASSQKFFKQ